MRQPRRIYFLPLLLLLLFPFAIHADTSVYFNTSTGKVHTMTCPSGRNCTRNCKIMPRSEAYKKGGVACKLCGG